MLKDTKISTNIDLEKTGKQIGYLSVPNSRNDSGWGAAHFPIAVIRNGTGPTVFISGGNHGDEYEGPIALTKFVRDVDPAEIQGTVIVMPYLNYPAVLEGKRLSPIDGMNMNRAFPGDRAGTVTSMVADFLSRFVLPKADAALDIHSGGKTMFFAPFGAVHKLADAALTEKSWQALCTLEPPIALKLVELDAEGMIDTTVEEMGKIFVTTELGGGSTTSVETIAIAERGIRNFLRHFEIRDDAMETRASLGLPPMRKMQMPDGAYTIAEHRGMVEMRVDIGDDVTAGQPILDIHPLEHLGDAPATYHAAAAGTIIGRIHGCLAAPGDFLAMIGNEEA